MRKIKMVDLSGQYANISNEINEAVINTIKSTDYINGPIVQQFQRNLENYLQVNHVIPCANGTDALQIAFMALGLQRGDEVIVPAFTYVATAEVIALLGLIPVMADVDLDTFDISIDHCKSLISSKTKAIVPVHLYGQSCDMQPILELAQAYNLFVIEDNAQAIGATYTFKNGTKMKTGAMGHIGTTSFFPTKNLGCYGDGGALMTQDSNLAEKIRMISNHGQQKKYHHEMIGVNSRLDSIQAAVLDIKLKFLDSYISARNQMASFYDQELHAIKDLTIPERKANSNHVFHQYTVKISRGKRDGLQNFLKSRGISSMVYYPIPLYKQKAFANYVAGDFELPNTEELCQSVLSLPIHTEGNKLEMGIITKSIKEFLE